jgi:catechol 2,3-dioxygenase-like lactoylglutathione lyase family enzyme
MFDHVSIGVRDIARAKRFYDAALARLGYSCLRDSPSLLGYGAGEVALWISPTESPVPPDPNSGLHFCFLAPDETAVQAFHRAALGAGGRDNGGPGIRREYSPGYYAAFAIDPDGYRVEAFCRSTQR